jgi:outer membrane murein-binding lipoprotein Lpp
VRRATKTHSAAAQTGATAEMRPPATTEVSTAHGMGCSATAKVSAASAQVSATAAKVSAAAAKMSAAAATVTAASAASSRGRECRAR